MAEGGDAEDRTEAPTPRRLQRAREQGRIPLSREIPVLASLGAAALLLMTVAPDSVKQGAGRLGVLLARPLLEDPADPTGAMRAALTAGLRLAGPFVAAALLAGVASVLLQTRGSVRLGALAPDLGRVSPRAGLARLFSLDTATETVKSLAKLAAMALALRLALSRATLAGIAAASQTDLAALPGAILRLVLQVLLAVLGIQALIAGLDLLWVRLRHKRSLSMSREDIREEQKEAEGDPRLKARLRQIRFQRARRRILAAVPKATVVLTNPTHYAVALAYDRAANAAPRVVAKGVDTMAERIRAIAAEHRVPVVANPPLARALHKLELEAEIPAEYYQAVAEIIAFVWRLGRGNQGARP